MAQRSPEILATIVIESLLETTSTYLTKVSPQIPKVHPLSMLTRKWVLSMYSMRFSSNKLDWNLFCNTSKWYGICNSINCSFSTLQWGTNQNVVFEFAVRKISILPTLKASRELKNWYFTTKFLPKHYL